MTLIIIDEGKRFGLKKNFNHTCTFKNKLKEKEKDNENQQESPTFFYRSSHDCDKYKFNVKFL